MLQLLSRFAGIAAVTASLVVAPRCSRLQLVAQDDLWSGGSPPPIEWLSAVAFSLPDSARVEFSDGVRTRLVSSRDRLANRFGQSPWYRIYRVGETEAVLTFRIDYPSAGSVIAAYPLKFERGAFYEVTAVRMLDNPNRLVVGAHDARAYAIPAAIRKGPSDSLWIYWGARDRKCWDCPN